MTPGKRIRILHIINCTNIIRNRATRGNDNQQKSGATALLIENNRFHAPEIPGSIGRKGDGERCSDRVTSKITIKCFLILLNL